MSELHAVQETRGSKCVSIWEKQSEGLFRSECSIAPRNPSVNQNKNGALVCKGAAVFYPFSGYIWNLRIYSSMQDWMISSAFARSSTSSTEVLLLTSRVLYTSKKCLISSK